MNFANTANTETTAANTNATGSARTSVQPHLLEPKLSLVIVRQLLMTAGVTFCAWGLIYALDTFVGIKLFVDVLEMIGMSASIDIASIKLWVTAGAFVLMSVISIITLLSAARTRCELYDDKLVIRTAPYILIASVDEIPYENITKLSGRSNDLFDSIMQTGTITFELSGMTLERMELPFVSDLKTTARSINTYLEERKAVRQARIIASINPSIQNSGPIGQPEEPVRNL